MSEKKKKLPYFSDVLLYKRVDKFLDDNIDKQMIDKDAMVDELRSTYKEYQRRNRSAFRMAVFKAYQMINQNILEVTQERSNDGSDVEAMDEQDNLQESSLQRNVDLPSGPSVAAAQMMQTYLQGLNSMASPISAKTSKNSNSELINISSDEGEDEPQAKRPAPAPTIFNPLRHSSIPFRGMHLQRPLVVDYNAHSTPRGGTIMPSQPDHNASHPYNHHSHREDDKRRKKPSKKDHHIPPTQYPAVSIFPSNKRAPGPSLPDNIPETTFSDFGGYPKVLQAINDLILHFYQSDIYTMLGVTPPRGFILHGPPGCGKTLLAHAVAGELHLPLVKVSGPELIGGISGESEERIRKIFQQAKQQVPCILFIDEIDVISQTRENARKDMERRIVSQLIVSLDDLSTCDEGDELIVIGATNRVEELDPGLRRAGRFDKEVCIGIPDRTARQGILKVLCRLLKMSSDISIKKIAELTPGFVAADLKSLISDAAVAAVKRIFLENTLKKGPFSKPKIVNEEPIKIADDDTIDEAVDSNVITPNDDRTSVNERTEKEDVNENQPEDVEEKKNDETENQTNDDNNESANEKESSTKEGKEASEDGQIADKPLQVSEGMDVDETSSQDKAQNMLDDDIPSAKEVIVENGASEEDKKSEDNEACVIVDDEKEPRVKMEAVRPKAASQFNIQIEMVDLMSALKTTQPSAKREGFATVPDVTWDDIGSLKDVRNELTMSIMMPVKYPEEFTRMGIDAPSGIMLWGPPGCGKTLLAKAIANEANINFISVKGPELLNMYVGESEKAVRTCFQRARNSQPCVIFFDEIDALCPRRSDSSEGSVSSRVVNQVLTEMDGVEGRKGVFLMAASNRPDMVDPAVLRPGRLDKIVKVGLPSAQDRVDILKAITKNGTKPPFDESVSLEKIANSPECEGYSGADLAALVKEASILALTDHLTLREAHTAQKTDVGKLCVSEKHFEDAMKKIKPSVHAEERKRYERLEKTFASMDH